jgi:hypothetical protein
LSAALGSAARQLQRPLHLRRQQAPALIGSLAFSISDIYIFSFSDTQLQRKRRAAAAAGLARRGGGSSGSSTSSAQ